MEDQFFQEMETLWSVAPPVSESAFVRYTRPAEGFRSESSIFTSNRRSMNKKMIEFLKAIPTDVNENREPGNGRGYRHMINERLRRDKQRQCYRSLHSVLPPRTKNDKNSIAQMAVLQLQALKDLNAELQRRNYELEAKLAVNEGVKPNVGRFRLWVCNTSSAMDSMVGILQCLKSMNLKTRMIRTEFSDQGFSAVMEIETQIESAPEVEKAVKNAVKEVERKLEFDFLERKEESAVISDQGNYGVITAFEWLDF